VVQQPTVESCDAPGSLCTEIKYKVTPRFGASFGSFDQFVVLTGDGVWYVSPAGSKVYLPGFGDPVTDLGEGSFHEQAVSFKPSAGNDIVTIGLAGVRQPNPTSVATKKSGSSKVGNCGGPILGLGLDPAGKGPLDIKTPEQRFTFGDCTLIATIPATGPVVVELSDDSPEECELLDPNGANLKDVELKVPVTGGGTHTSTGIQAESFSFVTDEGNPKCWSTVIPTPNGKLYTVCK
jgi:hypothetical protein